MIPYGRQEVTETDIEEIQKVLKSEYLTQGPAVPNFEKLVADYCKASYSVAVNSATSALHIACMALGLNHNDWLWTSPITFVASANCGVYCGAKIDFVDIDPNTYNISIDALSEKLKKADKIGKLPKIVIPVHFAGQPCDMKAIFELSKIYGFKIIEDASHAIGASYENIKVGSCTHSDMTVFSFHPVKIITTGEGGMILTNNDDLFNRLTRLRSNGITNNKKFMKETPTNEIWNYQQIDIGYNFRMNDIEAALGSSQIKRLDKYVSRRHEIAKRYNFELEKLNIDIPWQLPGTYSSYHLYPICITKHKTQKLQKEFYDFMWKNNVAVNLHYIPVYLQPYYQSMNFKRGYCPNAENYYKSAISIPIYQSLDFEDQSKVIKIISKFFK